ncbi:MAG: Flagellar basal-body rod protein FlgC [uncultured Acetobacteraceae bacterium]|uniref:Flagellar basal-body rod protein FlgC n=1 Tax=uncultured Acetobacteraceae bacterium TaxID=169975 RepID=A0A6J4J5K8_9PROT|nr:MAG: Flagellar basal-body rod protein FlgC [uncultured Acetobacteraceae bacterium]
MDLDNALRVSAAGLQAQSTRLRVVAENLANRDSTGSSPGADPYRRKTVTFGAHVERGLGAAGGVSTVKVSRVGTAPGEFTETYDPAHPAADARGYVKRPNVDSLIEVMDMREAQRSYSANVSVLEVTRGMLTRIIETLR